MSGRLTTHVLDTANGRPAAGIPIELARLDGERREVLRSVTTDDDGRTDGP
jgi:5-hydroxyisourate hydrolase